MVVVDVHPGTSRHCSSKSAISSTSTTIWRGATRIPGPLDHRCEPGSIKALQTYYDLNALDPTASLTKADAEMASELTGMPVTQYDWADALFMGLPNWTRWAARTGNSAYLDKLDALYAWTRDEGATSSRCAGSTPSQPGLFDSSRGLWYRDCTFVGVKDATGSPSFGREATAGSSLRWLRSLQTLPAADPRRAEVRGHVARHGCCSSAPLQGSDGFWRASLADPALFPSPETSGTALITYALAYGIKAGLLNATTYQPVVAKAGRGCRQCPCSPAVLSPIARRRVRVRPLPIPRPVREPGRPRRRRAPSTPMNRRSAPVPSCSPARRSRSSSPARRPGDR